MKENLSVREEKYSAIVENSTDGILIINEEGVIVEANKSIERITGFTKDECTNLPFSDFQSDLSLTSEQNQEKYDLLNDYLGSAEKLRRRFLV